MNTTYTDEELFSAVETAIRTVLNLKDQPMQPTTTLIADLGAESIDFLDISCELEKALEVELDFRKMIKERKAKANGSQVDVTLQDVVDYLKG